VKSKILMKPKKAMGIACAVGAVACFAAPVALALGGQSQDLGDVALHITGSFQKIAQLMIGTSYLAGIGFTIASIFKFKQHKDNPTQIPIGTPLALLVIGITLVFLPFIIKPAGSTIFGQTSDIQGGFTGGGVNVLPGSPTAETLPSK
jgi:intracellular multiplication protein IcmD